jgi:hypothetical protein
MSVPGTGFVGGGTFGLGGAALGAATLGVGVATTVALQHDAKEYAKLQAENDAAEKTTRDNLKNKRLDALVDLDKSGIYGGAKSDWKSAYNSGLGGESAGAFLTGNKTDFEVLQEQIEEETVRSFEDAIKNKIIPDTAANKKLLADVQESGGGGKAGKAAREKLLKLQAAEAKKLRELGNKRNTNEGIINSGGAQQILDAETATAQFQAGEIGYDAYVKALEESATALEAADNNDVEFHAKVLEARRKANEAASQAAQAQVQFVQQMIQATGGDPTAILANIDTALKDKRLRPEARGQLLGTYLSTQQQALQRAITNAPNAQEGLRLGTEGVAIDPAIKKQLEDYQVQAFGSVIFQIPETQKADADQLKQLRKNALQSTVLKLQRDNRNVQDPMELANIQIAIAELQYAGAENDEERYQAEIAAAEAQRQADNARLEVAKSRLALATAKRDDDPLADAYRKVQEAQLEVDDAKGKGEAAENAAAAAYDEAQRGVRDVIRDRVDARRELAKAVADEDPIRSAQIDIEAADEEMKRAGEDPAAQARALASRIKADHTLRDVMRDLADAQLELVATMAEIAGDVIQVADIGVKQAQIDLDRRIADVKAAGGNVDTDAQVIRLRGKLAKAKDAAGDTRLSEAEAEIDFLQQMGTIATSEAIARFEGLLSLADDPEETRRLLLKIKQLKEESAQDFQFNVPGNINLPTLYEMRRVQGTSNEFGLGSGYQDNRNYQVTLAINNGMDEASAKQFLADVFGTSSKVFGTTGRPY